MPKRLIVKAPTNVTEYIFIQDSSSTTGAGLTGLVFNSSGLVAYHVRPLAAAVQLTLATQTVTGAHTDGGFVEVSSANMPGVYRLDLSDAIVATGVDSVVLELKGAANMAPLVLEIQLTDFNLNVAKVTLADDSITAASLATDAVNEIRDALLPTQNVAFNNIPFTLVAASDHVTPVTGATGLAVTRSIDGAAFGAGTGTISEVGNGSYAYDASAADMNGGIIQFRFIATGGTPGAPDDRFVTVVTGGGV